MGDCHCSTKIELRQRGGVLFLECYYTDKREAMDYATVALTAAAAV